MVYVIGADGSDTASGSTWDEGLATVEAGLDLAETTGCDVWVKAGTYYPTEDPDGSSSPDDMRTLTFRLRSGVALFGGFAGDETDLSERDIHANATILSGDLGAIDSSYSNAFHVVTGAALASIDGFTITAGFADGNEWERTGGGMLNADCSPTVTSCTFFDNHASYGGGMLNYYSSPIVTSCTFESDSANAAGGGMYNYYSSPIVTNCTFAGNSATSYMSEPGRGAGMYNYESSPILTGCSFSANSAQLDGIAMYSEGVSPTVTNCILWGDIATSGEEGFEISSSSGSSSPIVTYSAVQGGCTVDAGCTTDETGNIDADPLFADALAGDLHLQADSPCIDTGSTDALPADTADLDDDGDVLEDIPFDLDGNPRVVGAAVDMGAYEYQP